MAKPGVPAAGGDYAPLPEMTWILARVAGGEDAPSIAPSKFKNDKGEIKDQVTVIFDAVYYMDEDGEKVEVDGSRIWFYGGVSLHEKAKLRPLAIALMPETVTLDVLTAEQAADKSRLPNLFADFDTDDIAGKYVWVMGDYKDPDDKKYLRPTAFKRAKVKAAPAAAAAPKAEPKKEPKKAAVTPDGETIDI